MASERQFKAGRQLQPAGDGFHLFRHRLVGLRARLGMAETIKSSRISFSSAFNRLGSIRTLLSSPWLSMSPSPSRRRTHRQRAWTQFRLRLGHLGLHRLRLFHHPMKSMITLL